MECLFVFGFFLVFGLFGKYILAGFAILFGDKESLHQFGNLCDEPIPWKDQVYSPEERGLEPPDPPTNTGWGGVNDDDDWRRFWAGDDDKKS